MRMFYHNVKQGFFTFIFLFIFSNFQAAHAGSLEQAKQLHDRIAGVPADAQTLTELSELITAGDPIAAAYQVMESPDFYNTTLKLFASPWTNEDEDIFVPLNDYSATVIGIVRDDIDFRQLLQADIAYVGSSELTLPAYSMTNNAHYEALENQAINLKEHLTQVSQSSLNGLPPTATAGVLTSRAAARAFFYLGTNRAMFRFTLMNHLCTDLEPLKDNTRSPDRIRQDVSRSPGGDSRLFLNNCLACHSGMDPMAQAFAYYDFDFTDDADTGSLVYNNVGTIAATGSRVQAKYHLNATNFPYGFITPDDEWNNYWRQGPNQKLGWDQGLTGKGAGAKSLGEELSHSQAFAQCQVKKVFENVCLRSPESQDDLNQVTSTTASFATHDYKLKRVFAEIGTYCMGE
ncbi:hypothetical protein [Algibacillus agarilyticus]|uniref:hypothetical protein n=1 Tax=Algibacillus agarilyticus TaxID=2234133 RepID=UPI001E43B320|nr:hypothetical protein [Algibacillus agarilyticus]